MDGSVAKSVNESNGRCNVPRVRFARCWFDCGKVVGGGHEAGEKHLDARQPFDPVLRGRVNVIDEMPGRVREVIGLRFSFMTA